MICFSVRDFYVNDVRKMRTSGISDVTALYAICPATYIKCTELALWIYCVAEVVHLAANICWCLSVYGSGSIR